MSSEIIINAFVRIISIVFLKLIASPKADKDPAIITGICDCFANPALGSTRRFKINFWRFIHCPYPKGWFANGIEIAFHSPCVDGRRPALLTEEALDLFNR